MAIRFRERTIDDFKGKLVGGGVRPNLFEVNINFPAALGSLVSPGGLSEQAVQEKMRFMIKAAELPASNVGDIPVAFRGRVLHVAGDRTFDPWTVTIINDVDFGIRRAMERWSNAINNHEFDSGETNPNTYQSDANVFQLGRKVSKDGETHPNSEKIQVPRNLSNSGRPFLWITVRPIRLKSSRFSSKSTGGMHTKMVLTDLQI